MPLSPQALLQQLMLFVFSAFQFEDALVMIKNCDTHNLLSTFLSHNELVEMLLQNLGGQGESADNRRFAQWASGRPSRFIAAGEGLIGKIRTTKLRRGGQDAGCGE